MTFLFICRSQKDKRGEEREGTYAARAQIGTEKDGSPMYRYFDSVEKYKNYLAKKNKKPKEGATTEADTSEDKSDKESDKESLKEKTAKEHAQSTEKHRAAQRSAKEKQTFGKSVTLYVKVSK